MTPTFIVDTGPLVALFEANDHFHRWAVEALETEVRLVTCEAVLSETCFLLGRGSKKPALAALFEFVAQGGLELVPLHEEMRSVGRLLARYRNVPMSFADACLVRLAELTPDARVMTFDRDFTGYRQHERRVIPLMSPS